MHELHRFIDRVDSWLPPSESVEFHNRLVVIRTLEGDVLETKQTEEGLYHRITLQNEPTRVDVLSSEVSCDDRLRLGDVEIEYREGHLCLC